MSREELKALMATDSRIASFLANLPDALVWIFDGEGQPLLVEHLLAASFANSCNLDDHNLGCINERIRTLPRTDQLIRVQMSSGMREFRACSMKLDGARIVVALRNVTVEQKLERELKKTSAALRALNFGLDHSSEEALHLALADPLTGLPNRRAFDVELARSCEAGKFALCLLDMDRFKAVNDALGHTVGDRLLMEVGERLRQQARGKDFVGRLAGDEFAIVFHNISSVSAAEEAAGRILAAFGGRIDLGDVDIQASLTAGVAVARRGDDPAALYRRADMALHTAKAKRRGALVVDAGDPSHLGEHDDLVIAKALMGDAPVPVTLVPIRDAGHVVVGHEAMVGGLADRAATQRVFATAAKFGLVDDLFARTLRAVLEAATRRPGHAPVHLLVPAAVRATSSLADQILGAMREAGLVPRELVVDLSLGAFEREGTAACAARLRRAGLALALSDWDMSLASLEQAASGDFAMVKFEMRRASPLLFAPQITPVWRAAFASLASLGVVACATGVSTKALAKEVIGLGATAIVTPPLAKERDGRFTFASFSSAA
ncbi:GGDEF domain-containing protein [Acuticoccus mangrovi]|uniref:Diguanylate cyclase n=1 Tax=Acuticoccus mangrovi TaxID=2796142 RepID=A0A934INL0_9HYPH|nr:diguanylate cyclase [Acuticoccus mangrovi]MBJ3778216.1 diguanylate cyclase [Acuticoccus mangrovi]